MRSFVTRQLFARQLRSLTPSFAGRPSRRARFRPTRLYRAHFRPSRLYRAHPYRRGRHRRCRSRQIPFGRSASGRPSHVAISVVSTGARSASGEPYLPRIGKPIAEVGLSTRACGPRSRRAFGGLSMCLVNGEAGTAGLSALREVRRYTDDFLLVNDGHWGTTCAAVGCMPSKALIEAANAFKRRSSFDEFGIRGAEMLRADVPAVLARVRRMRDGFVKGPELMREKLGKRAQSGRARLLGPRRLEVNGETIEARAIILAPGSSPVVPGPWRAFGERILTTTRCSSRRICHAASENGDETEIATRHTYGNTNRHRRSRSVPI